MSLKDYFLNKRIDKFERNYKLMMSRYKYDPKKVVKNVVQELGTEEFSKRIAEFQAWSTGSPYMIRQFYLNNSDVETNNFNYFWKDAPNTRIMKHTGVPLQIASLFSEILFSKGFKIKAVMYGEDGEIDQDKTNEATDLLQSLMRKSSILESLSKQAFIESWCGHSFGKFSYKTDISNYPIYEVTDLTNAEVVKDRNIKVSEVFKTYYEKKVGTTIVNYRLEETYGINQIQEPTISYALYKLNEDGEDAICPLTEIDETLGLYTAISTFAEDNNGMLTITFTGLKGWLAFDKPNKLPNGEFPNSPYGRSDFAGSIDSFDGMDEIYSEFSSETRNNKSKTFVPSTMLKPSFNGNASKLDPFCTNFIQVESSLDQNGGGKLEKQEFLDKTESLKAKYLVYLVNACNNAGISPLALGYTGLEAVTASDDSQKERNRVTEATRADKINMYWLPYLKDMIKQFLRFNTWMRENLGVVQEEDTTNVDFEACEIQCEFGEYSVESQDKIINRWAAAKQGGLSSVETAVRELHPNWTEEQVAIEVNKIKAENNMSLDDPSLLQMDTE